jgi:hypothetical protein
VIVDKKTCGWIEVAGCGDYGNVLPGIAKANVRGIEAHGIFVGFEKTAYPDAEDGPEENVGVEHQAFRFRHLFCFARQRLKSATACYVTAVGKRIVVVHVFEEKTQKTPRREILTALKRAKEVQ